MLLLHCQVVTAWHKSNCQQNIKVLMEITGSLHTVQNEGNKIAILCAACTAQRNQSLKKTYKTQPYVSRAEVGRYVNITRR